MKKETPHSWKRGAGLADGLKTVAPDAGVPTTGRDQRKSAVRKREARSPAHRSPTVVGVSQVALNHPGRDHVTRWAILGGPAPASKIEEGMGTARPLLVWAVVLCLLTTLSIQQ